jgi:hypothetical protein
MTDDSPTATNVTAMSLRELRLRPGMALQTRRLVEGASKKESQFLAAIEGKGVMVGPVGPDGVSTELEAGEVCVVRGFTGQHEFSFLSKVLQTFETPFAYALLQYPKRVDATLVRQSMRIKTSMPAELAVFTQADTGKASSAGVTLIDISMAGAMIRSMAAMAPVGVEVSLAFSVDFEGAAVQLVLAGTVCHSHTPLGQEGCLMGLAFRNLKQHDKLVLHYMTQTRTS